MKKQIAITIAAAALMLAAPAKQTFTGVITDSMCANADHKAMNMGADVGCVTACVKAGAKYVLYRLGPDGKDDGGKPVQGVHGREPDIRYHVHPDSKGDIVAGLNAR